MFFPKRSSGFRRHRTATRADLAFVHLQVGVGLVHELVRHHTATSVRTESSVPPIGTRCPLNSSVRLQAGLRAHKRILTPGFTMTGSVGNGINLRVPGFGPQKAKILTGLLHPIR